MTFKLFGTKITVSFIFAAIIVLVIATDRSTYALPVIIAAAIHEAAHLFAMWAADEAPSEVNLIAGSVRIVKKPTAKSAHEIIILLCGPLANLLLFFVFYADYVFHTKDSTLVFAAVNLITGLYNLLPAKGLDGGSILYCIFEKKSVQKAKQALNISSVLTCAVLIIASVLLTATGNVNRGFIVAAIYILICVIIKL